MSKLAERLNENSQRVRENEKRVVAQLAFVERLQASGRSTRSEAGTRSAAAQKTNRARKGNGKRLSLASKKVAWEPFTPRLAQIKLVHCTSLDWVTRRNQHRDRLGRSRPGPTIASHPSPSAARPSPIHHRATPNRASPKRADDRRQRHKKILVDNMSGRAKVNNHNHRRAPHSHTLGSTTPRQDPKSRRWPTSSQQTASQQRPVCACEHSFRAIPA